MTIGAGKFAYDIWGDTVNISSRLESNGETTTPPKWIWMSCGGARELDFAG
jgi:class 3 adenylate cyclase